MPSDATIAHMLTLCDERLLELTGDGVDEGVALDRIFDCFEQAINHSDKRCYDQRDRIFENRLRTAERKGITNG